MTERTLHEWAILTQFVLAAVTCLGLLFITAPYGRYQRKGWGPSLPTTAGWILMEFPAVVIFSLIFVTGNHAFAAVPLVFLAMWHIHYVNRAFIFPVRLHSGSTRMPLLIPMLGILFNSLNAYINARWISHFGRYGTEWLTDPRFLIGCVIFVAGWLGNIHSYAVLRKLRRTGDREYRIPNGGLFRWISAPNYACEILEWTGLGNRYVVASRTSFRGVHSGQSRSERSQAPCLVPENISRLSQRSESTAPKNLLTTEDDRKPVRQQ